MGLEQRADRGVGVRAAQHHVGAAAVDLGHAGQRGERLALGAAELGER